MADDTQPPAAIDADGWIEIGFVLRAHGIRGMVVVRPHNPRSDSLARGKIVRLSKEGQVSERRILSLTESGGGFRLSLDGVVGRDAAEALRGSAVSLRVKDLPEPEEGEFYHHQLIGLEVRDPAGVVLGRLSDIYEIAAHDVYVVRTVQGEEVQVPAVGAYVKEIDVGAGFLVIDGLDRLM